MASACLNSIRLSPETLPECSKNYSSYGIFRSRLSISSKMPEKTLTDLQDVSDPKEKEVSDLPVESDSNEFDGFEFRLADEVMMLPADELFSDGKLIPLQFSMRQESTASETNNIVSISNELIREDSPRAPRCSSRWKELLGFKKQCRNDAAAKKVTNNGSGTGTTRSIRQLLYGNGSSKSSTDSPINVPLLKDPETECASVASISSRLSFSSSSSGHDIDDLPRLSLDSDRFSSKLNPNIRPKTRTDTKNMKMKMKSEPRASTSTRVARMNNSNSNSSDAALTCIVDSPRINSSGKIIFQSLERSSSSPSTLTGGPRFKHRGMERSYSGNVRITPVLNVPVCSLRGSSKSGGVFGLFSSNSNSNNGGSGSNRSQRFNGRN